jgi:ferrochelatase
VHPALPALRDVELRDVRTTARIPVEVVPPYFEDPGYVAALAASASPYLERGHDHLLFSFHGLPVRQLRKRDPTGSRCLRIQDCCLGSSEVHRTCYRAQCLATVDAFVRATGVTRHSVAFQSRLGREEWLAPATDAEVVRLAREGVRRLLVICPAFVADCLETLEEIALRAREAFLAAGGTEFAMIPCLNTHPLWIEALATMVDAQSLRPARSDDLGNGRPAWHG